MSRTSHRYRASAQTGGPRQHAGSWRAAVERLLPLAVPAAVLLGWGRGDRLREALQQSRTALHTMREHLNGIVSRAPVGIVQTDLDGRILLANERFCGLVGHGTAHLRTLRLHDMAHPDDRPVHLERRATMLATGEPCEFEIRLVGADDSHVWVTGHLALTLDSDGRPTHVVAAIQDISRRREAEAALLALTATLEQRVASAVAERLAMQEDLRQAQRMEALGQLAGGVAHDFNNVLQAIAGGARLIQRRPGDIEAVQRLAGLVVDAAERGANVTQRLLSFARRGPLQPGEVDVAVLLADLRDILAGTMGGGLQVELTLPDTLPPVFADRRQLETVLANLAVNARDAMTGDDAEPKMPGMTFMVRLSATMADGTPAGLPQARYIRIDIADSGAGMDPLTLEPAAEPFFTTKSRGRGTGLGLAVARGFAEQSGGRLTLQSQAGVGTTASLWLPQAHQPSDQPTDALTPVAASQALIVVVDDDADVRAVLCELLTSCGYGVLDFDGAAPALSYLDEAEPTHLLITDLSMPDTDGLTLIHEARRRRPGLPAILLTGYGRTEMERALGQTGGGRLTLLQKPVRADVLVTLVAALVSDAVAAQG